MCEALIGAVFLDGGYPAAAALIERLWGERMRTPARPLRDPKTVLQEWAQARGLPTPSYREVERTGPHHDPEFRVSVALPELMPAEGLGRSKRAAEQAAAAAMLAREGIDRRTRASVDAASQRHDDRRPNPLRFCRPDRRAQRRQIDAHQRAGRREGHDRQPEGADDAHAVRGIAIEGTAQIIFVDTPGIFAPRRRLDRAMVTTAWGGAHDADIVALLVDAKRGIDEESGAILDRLGDVAGASSRAQQDRSGGEAEAARARAEANGGRNSPPPS